MSRFLRVVLVVTMMFAVFIPALMWGGALTSGSLFLALPTGVPATAHDLPSSYVPTHGGGVDTSSGLYVREDDDLLLTGTPSFIFTRTYRNQDRVSRAFGIGASNNAEWYLIGDSRSFQWLQLILADGGRVDFGRVSSGSSYWNARFVNFGSATAFNRAHVGWMGRQWLLRYQDGSLAWFRGCGPSTAHACSLEQLRDVDGHVVDFHRNARGMVEAIEAGAQSIRLQYDDRGRIVQGATNTGQQVTYSYDSAGRLHQAVSSDGTTRVYGYGPSDELVSIEEPGRVIENQYDAAGRVIRQVTKGPRLDESSTPWVFEFEYKTVDDEVIETDVTEPDGSHTVYRFADHRTVLEIYDARGEHPIMVSIDRGDADGAVTALTVRCRSNGRRVTRTATVTAGDEENVKRNLITGECAAGGEPR